MDVTTGEELECCFSEGYKKVEKCEKNVDKVAAGIIST